MTIKVGLVSLGCPKNLVDSEIMLGLLKDAGFIVTNRDQEADVLIVNTCSFINDAKEESIKTILELARRKEGGRCRALLVAGCLAQRYSEELLAEMPEIDGLIGTGSVSEILQVIRRVLAGERVSLVGAPGYLHTARLPRIQATPSYTAYLKIAEGCDNRCSYCTIPAVRGPFRSREQGDILAEAAGLARRGVKELILVAQDTTRYGVDLYGRAALTELVGRLAEVDGLIWLRLLYAYPALITDELIRLLATEKKLCRYLDIPLQHAADPVLLRMNRRGTGEEAVRLIEKLRSAVPGITLRTSFMVGFPGETEEDFRGLLDFMARVKFDRAGVFVYSREEGTAAAEMSGQVPEEVKLERRARAMALQQMISLEKNRERIGEVITVLVEGCRSRRRGMYSGRSEGDAPEIDGKVFFKSSVDLRAGDFVKVLVKGARAYDLTGELVS
ncbi:MAG: 30S ribosomal protein S12 methylthiotransferase RimO [Peptococcaceae bacterium]|nr:30S ribosomal protein S12 methylthiotransferase RimO [Peptococcaceae bacterium]